MAHIPEEEDGRRKTGDETEDNSDGLPSSVSRPAFIGCTVPRYIKDKLIAMAMNAPGGARNVSWAINQILSERFANKQEQK